MKKGTWLLAAAAGAGVAAIAYKAMSKDIPDGATAVQPFEISRYLGKWYEVARLPNRVEKNIKDLTEEYSVREDGMIKVVTRGYNYKKNTWKEVSGKIKYAGANDIGMLKVSYFGPFYAAYNILDIDPDYQYALVSGSGLDYLWILSREKTIPDQVKAQFLYKAAKIGFIIEQLDWV